MQTEQQPAMNGERSWGANRSPSPNHPMKYIVHISELSMMKYQVEASSDEAAEEKAEEHYEQGVTPMQEQCIEWRCEGVTHIQ